MVAFWEKKQQLKIISIYQKDSVENNIHMTRGRKENLEKGKFENFSFQ